MRKSLFLWETFSDFALEGRSKNSRFHFKATSNNPCGQMKLCTILQDRTDTNEKSHLIWWDELKTGDVKWDCNEIGEGLHRRLPIKIFLERDFINFITALSHLISFRLRIVKFNLSSRIKYFKPSFTLRKERKLQQFEHLTEGNELKRSSLKECLWGSNYDKAIK